MDTYYYVATIEAGSEEEAFEFVGDVAHDPPTELPTIDEMADRISTALIRYAAELRDAPDFGARVEVAKAWTALVLEIVTLGGVPAT